jgi:uncharacterized damage-inducible protein DinB
MARIEQICEHWQEVRNGLIKEVELIPAEQFQFRATPETRSIVELLQHIIQSERLIVGEVCRVNTDFKRGFPAMVAEFAGQVGEASTKDSISELLRTSLQESTTKACEFGDANLERIMTRFDGKQLPKLEMPTFSVAHEMYHRGQLTVYQRLLGIEPALTTFFRKVMSSAS